MTRDLSRLYGQMGPAAVLFVGTAAAWAAFVAWALVAGSRPLTAPAGDERRWTRRGSALVLVGGILLSSVVPGTVMGLGAYLQAEDGGFEPARSSLGSVLAALWLGGAGLLLAGCGVLAVAGVATRLRGLRR